MLKKIILNVFVFVGIFFVIDKVSAASYYFTSQPTFVDYNDSTHDLRNDMDAIIEVAKANNLDLFIYTHNYLTEPDDSSGAGDNCYSSPSGTRCEYITGYYVIYFNNNSNYQFKITSTGVFRNYASGFYQYHLDLTSNYETNYNALLESLNNSDFSSFTSKTGNYIFTFNSQHHNRIYGGTFDGTLSAVEDNTFYYDGKQLKVGDLIPSYMNYVKTYETYDLSSITYSAIEVQFNIDDFTMVDEGNDINLDYEIYLNNDMILTLLPIPQEKVYRNFAPSEYSLGTTVNLMFDEKANNYSYEGTKHYDYWNTVTYRFEFPFTSDYIGNITFKFWSDSSYTITLEERDNEENDIKYTELDLTGKYGVGFIPKVTSFDTLNEFYGIFKVPYQNSYRLMFYKDYQYINQNNNKNLLVDSTLLSLENFEYKFTKDNSNSYLLFINNNFKNGNKASILYNSNYFNYCILDESISTCDIVNPNSDESIAIEPNLSDKDSFGLKNIFNSFLSFSNSTNFILENVTNFYNNYLPSELQAFFFISFGFVVIIMITKIVL